MKTLLSFLPVLGCAGAMVLCMRMMGGKQRSSSDDQSDTGRDDVAAELQAAAKKIDATHSPTAIVTGWGADLDAVCETLRASYGEIWKIANEALAYPNAELVRQALVRVLPPGSILLVPHAHFGVDLSPGLSIRMNAAYVPDALDIEGVEGATMKLVRQEFGGQVSAHSSFGGGQLLAPVEA